MESIEYRGSWWLPENPDTKVGGILTFSRQKGGKLELIGSFKSVLEGNIGGVDTYPIILGVTTDGKLITLQNCFVTNYNFSSTMTQATDLLAHFIYTGIHISEENDFKFNKIQAKFTYLYDWVGVSGISHERLEEGQKFQVTYAMPEDISIPIQGGKIEITFGANIKSNYDFASLNEKTSIFIECNESKNFYEISQNYLFPLQALISLGTTKSNFVEELYFFHTEHPENQVAVYYAQNFYKPKVKDYLLAPDMLFTLSDIYEDLEAKINNWISLVKEIDSVLHLLNRVRISSEMFLELKFLTIAQAVETYHRRRRNNEIMPLTEHKARVEGILNNLSEEHGAWLEKILNHTNEPRLAHRINDLLNEHKTILNPLINNPQDSNSRRGKFTNAVVGSRNFYTHLDKAGEGAALKGADLHWLTEKLSILIQACLINEIGILPEKQADLFTQNEHYNWLKSK